MKIKCINEESGLVLDNIYEVIINHHEGYELFNDPLIYDKNHFEIIEESEEDLFYQTYGMTQDEYLEIYGELPIT